MVDKGISYVAAAKMTGESDNQWSEYFHLLSTCNYITFIVDYMPTISQYLLANVYMQGFLQNGWRRTGCHSLTYCPPLECFDLVIIV